ncbi:MAG: helix-turn-helix domain-containing protein [Alphaproteobacteria bacterium]
MSQKQFTRQVDEFVEHVEKFLLHHTWMQESPTPRDFDLRMTAREEARQSGRLLAEALAEDHPAVAEGVRNMVHCVAQMGDLNTYAIWPDLRERLKRLAAEAVTANHSATGESRIKYYVEQEDPEARGTSFVRDAANEYDPATKAPVTKDMACVLLALQNSPTIMSQGDIGKATPISKRTIQNIMPKLEARRWVIRPDGERSGYMLTPEGERIVATLKPGA